MPNGIRSIVFCLGMNHRRVVIDAGSTTGKCWNEFCGCCGAVLVGRTCRHGIRRRRRVGGDCNTGKMPVCGWQSGGPSSQSSMTRDNSTGMKSLPTARSPRHKKGGRGRKDQTRKGYEAYDGGRRQGWASRSRTCLGVAAGVHVDRVDSGPGRCAAYRTGPTADEPRAIDLRSGR